MLKQLVTSLSLSTNSNEAPGKNQSETTDVYEFMERLQNLIYPEKDKPRRNALLVLDHFPVYIATDEVVSDLPAEYEHKWSELFRATSQIPMFVIVSTPRRLEWSALQSQDGTDEDGSSAESPSYSMQGSYIPSALEASTHGLFYTSSTEPHEVNARKSLLRWPARLPNLLNILNSQILRHGVQHVRRTLAGGNDLFSELTSLEVASLENQKAWRLIDWYF